METPKVVCVLISNSPSAGMKRVLGKESGGMKAVVLWS